MHTFSLIPTTRCSCGNGMRVCVCVCLYVTSESLPTQTINTPTGLAAVTPSPSLTLPAISPEGGDVPVHAVLLCLVCLFDLACFFLPSFSSLIKTCTQTHNLPLMYDHHTHVCLQISQCHVRCMYMYLLDSTKQPCCLEWFVRGLYNYIHSRYGTA